MFEALREAEKKYEEIGEKLMQPDVIGNEELFKNLMKEHKTLTPIIEKYREYVKVQKDIEGAQEIIREETDRELRELAEEELYENKEALEKITEELKILLLPRDENDDKNVIVEIRAGTGGEEAALFAHSLHRMYTMYAEAKGFKCELMNINETELGGCKEVSFMVEGDGAFSRFKFESGVHRVQRVPETETQGRIHTSAVTVAVLPEAEEVDIEINPADLEIDTYRSGGAGGQHVNKTDSAVRITHIPTGIIVGCQTERSQLQNRETCLKMLRSKLAEIKAREKLEKIDDIRGDKLNIEWGSQIRSYVFMPYTLVKDTRTGYEDGNISAVMDGDLDGFMNAFLKAKGEYLR